MTPSRPWREVRAEAHALGRPLTEEESAAVLKALFEATHTGPPDLCPDCLPQVLGAPVVSAPDGLTDVPWVTLTGPDPDCACYTWTCLCRAQWVQPNRDEAEAEALYHGSRCEKGQTLYKTRQEDA